MKLLFNFLAVLAMSLFTLTLASAKDIQHEMGTTSVPDAPKRIIVLEFSFIDALASVGVSPVGIADDKKTDRVIDAYTKVIGDEWVSVGTRKTPSLEIIASLNPDLIIADKKRHAAVFEQLLEIAPTIVLDSLGGNYHDSVSQMAVIGDAIGKGAEMTLRIEQHRALMKDYAAQIAPKAKGVRAQFGVANAKGLWLHSPLSYNGSLLAALGFENGMKAQEGGVYEATYVPTTLEQLSEVNPDMLLLGEYADPSFIDNIADEVLFKDLSAVKSNKVFFVTAHNWSRLRGMLAAELTAQDLVEIFEGSE